MPIKTNIGLKVVYINLNTDSMYGRENLLAPKLKLRRAKDIQYNWSLGPHQAGQLFPSSKIIK